MMSINSAYGSKSSKKCSRGAFWFFLIGLLLGVFLGQSSYYRQYYDEVAAFIISQAGGKDSAVSKWLISKQPEAPTQKHQSEKAVTPPASSPSKTANDHRVSEPLPILEISPAPAAPGSSSAVTKP
jgi:hypothetical protein